MTRSERRFAPSDAREATRATAGWAVTTGAVVVVGCVMSFLSARATAHDQDATARQSFERSALEITSSLRAAIQRDEDLVLSTKTVFGNNPDIATSELQGWVDAVGAGDRHPELSGVGAVRFVPAADLDDYVALLHADPRVALGGGEDLQIVPAGERAYYCFLQAQIVLDPTQVPISPGVDLCTGDFGPPILAARDSGTTSYRAIEINDDVHLLVQAPVYAGGVDPATLATRRASFVGLIGVSIETDELFAAVLRNHPDATISLGFDDGVSNAMFHSGEVATDAESVDYDFGNGWVATISMPAAPTGIFASTGAVTVLIAGSLASLVLGLLIFELGTSRRRALRLVVRRTDQLNHQALHDSLTNLPNRTLILDRAEQMLTRCRRNGSVGAALYVDLDGFKDVNDSLGHEAGDQLLRAVAVRLTTSLRGVDTIGRMGGDEFVVLIDDASLDIAPELVAERLLDVLRQPFELDLSARPLIVTASVGIATGDRTAAGDLLRDADIALYQAKDGGRNRYVVFRPDMEAAVQRQFTLELDLRSALQAGEFRLFYQPIYDLPELTIIGAEALIRWDHPTRGLLLPDEFLPQLEASGQIVEVGRWILTQACCQARQWHDQGDDLTMWINLAAGQLDRDSIVEHVAEALATSGIDPARVTLEITETVLMKDAELTSDRLHALKALGVQLAIDDFGTGYSSLAYLQRFPVDCLKIDRTFTDAIARTSESDALFQTLVKLGKNLNLRTLAEGIETAGQLDYLRGVEIDQAQGFLLARPLSAADFDSKLLLLRSTAQQVT